MIDKKAIRSTPSRRIEKLLTVLNEQYRVLVSANCDKKLISEYAALIRFLKSASTQELQRIFSKSFPIHQAALREAGSPQEQLNPSDSERKDISNMSEREIENLVRDETTPRKDLEYIAVQRFNVPRGSMRSFSNREMLVEKLMTLLRNEQVHVSIETVAKRQVER